MKYHIRCNKPDVIFLFEMLVHANKIEEIRYRVGFDYCFAVNKLVRDGGLAVLWKNNLKLEILNFSQNYINI